MQEIDFKVQYLIYELNGDALICQKTLTKIKEHYAIKEMSISEFNDENFEALSVINSANQFSFFDDKRLIVINNIEKALTKDEQAIFNSYTKNPNKNAIIVIVNSYGYNAFEFIKDKKVIDCMADNFYSYNYIKNEFEKRGKKIQQPEIKLLADYCMNDMVKIELEISKICAYMQDYSEVTKQIIENLVVKNEEIKVFDLVDALSKRDIKKAHQILYGMQRQNEPIIKTLGLIAGHFRRLFFSKINKNKTNAELATQLGCKEYAISKAKQQAELFTASQLKNIENLILETDYNIKSGNMAQENGLYYLIFSIVNM